MGPAFFPKEADFPQKSLKISASRLRPALRIDLFGIGRFRSRTYNPAGQAAYQDEVGVPNVIGQRGQSASQEKRRI
jgi:hypothetical protein